MPPKGWKKDLSDKKEVSMNEKQPKPTQDQINEVIDPSLSQDSFKLGDKTFPIQILPISYEKKLVLLVVPLVKKIQTFEGKTVWQIIQESIEQDVEDGFNTIVQFILTICHKYDTNMTQEWVEDNVNLSLAISIILKQLKKNEISSMVSSFFLAAARLMPLMPKGPESQPNLGN